MYFIACDFKLTEHGSTVKGFAVCNTPDDVVAFLFADGTPVKTQEMWTYQLKHYRPWAHITNE